MGEWQSSYSASFLCQAGVRVRCVPAGAAGTPLRMWSHHLGARSWCPQVSASQWVAFVGPAGVQEVLSKLFLNNEIHGEQ